MDAYRFEECGCDCRETDHGPEPFTVNVAGAARRNRNFRTVLWTGCHLQLALMDIPPCGEIGLEIHSDTDQFIRVERGQALACTGSCKERLDFQRRLGTGEAVFVPKGMWHNVRNIGNCPLKLSTFYAPPEHARGTVHRTKADAAHEEH